MPSNHDKWVDPLAPASDRPCPRCGQAYQYHPSIGWIMLGPCDHCAESLPGTGSWGRLANGSPQWRLHPEDEWRTLTPAQAAIKDAEEHTAVEAIRRRRRLN